MEKLENRIDLLRSKKDLAKNIVHTYETPNKNYAELIRQLPLQKREMANKLFPKILDTIPKTYGEEQRYDDAMSILANKLGVEKELHLSPNDAYAEEWFHTSGGLMTEKMRDEENNKILARWFKNNEYFEKNKQDIQNLLNILNIFKEYIDSMPLNYIRQLPDIDKKYEILKNLVRKIISGVEQAEMIEIVNGRENIKNYKLKSDHLKEDLKNLVIRSLNIIYYLWDYPEVRSFYKDFLNRKNLLKKSFVYKDNPIYEHIKSRNGNLPADIENMKRNVQKLN